MRVNLDCVECYCNLFNGMYICHLDFSYYYYFYLQKCIIDYQKAIAIGSNYLMPVIICSIYLI